VADQQNGTMQGDRGDAKAQPCEPNGIIRERQGQGNHGDVQRTGEGRGSD
jgi:hypothetical protein